MDIEPRAVELPARTNQCRARTNWRRASPIDDGAGRATIFSQGHGGRERNGCGAGEGERGMSRSQRGKGRGPTAPHLNPAGDEERGRSHSTAQVHAGGHMGCGTKVMSFFFPITSLHCWVL